MIRNRNIQPIGKCSVDADCISSLCNKGQCVECVFDTDCHGMMTCENGHCLGENECVGLPFKDSCFVTSTEVLPMTVNFDVREEAPPLKTMIWSTLKIVNVEYATIQQTNETFYTCSSEYGTEFHNNVSTKDIKTAPFGTLQHATNATNYDICKLPTQHSSDGNIKYEWHGCDNIDTKTGSELLPNGNFITAEWYSNDNGSISVVYDSNNLTGLIFQPVVKVTYSVEDSNSCLHYGILYHNVDLSLESFS